jgi:nicotinate phosphoribosyltransferase
VDGFGVGTRLVASEDAASLGGVYKLVAVEEDGRWQGRLKLSADKATYPGRKQVYRFSDAGRFTHDLLATADEPAPPGAEPLLAPLMREGELVAGLPALPAVRERARDQLARLPARHQRLREAEPYPVRVSDRLQRRFERLARQVKEDDR